jgi:hypothetical protein
VKGESLSRLEYEAISKIGLNLTPGYGTPLFGDPAHIGEGQENIVREDIVYEAVGIAVTEGIGRICKHSGSDLRLR